MKNKNIPNYDPNAGFANHRGLRPDVEGEGALYNDRLRAYAEAIPEDRRSETVFAGAMNMLGLHGQEHGDSQHPFENFREFSSEKRSRSHDPSAFSVELAMREFHIGAANGQTVRHEAAGSQTPVSVEITDRFDFADEGTGEVDEKRKTRVTTITLKPKDGEGAVTRPAGVVEAPFIPAYGKRKGAWTHTRAAKHSPSRATQGEAHYGADEQLNEVSVELVDGKIATVGWKRVGAEKPEWHDITKTRSEARANPNNLNYQDLERQIDSILNRVSGMMEVANTTLETEKGRRIQAAEDFASAMKHTREREAARFEELMNEPLPKIEDKDLPF